MTSNPQRRRRATTKRLQVVASALLPEVDRRLHKVYRTAPLGNKCNPLDELVFIQLSIRTREAAYHSTYRNLRRLLRGSWHRLHDLPASQCHSALAEGGMAATKRKRLLRTFALLKLQFGRVTLAPLRHLGDNDAERVLRRLPGVGAKVARCILLYSLGRSVLPVDTHTFRVLSRIGLVPKGLSHRGSHDLLNAITPRSLRGRLHINLVHHGRAICTSAQPRCTACALLDLCPYGQTLRHTPANRTFN